MKHKTTLFSTLLISLALAVLIGVGCAAPASPGSAPAPTVVVETAVVAEKVVVVTAPPATGQPTQAVRLCDPEHPTFKKVSDILAEQKIQIIIGDSTLIKDGKVAHVDYTSSKGQTFRLSVHASTEDASRSLLQAMAICFEARPVPRGKDAREEMAFQLDELQADAVLREVVAASIKYQVENLAELRDKYLGTAGGQGTPSVAGLLNWVDPNLNPDEVFNTALETVTKTIETRTFSGGLTAELAKTIIGELYRTMFYEDPHLAVLAPPQLDPQKDLSMIVEMDWTNPGKEGGKVDEYLVDFALHPSIAKDKWHIYQWLKRTYVEAQIYVSNGKVSLSVWRQNSSYNYQGGRTASAGQWSGWVTASSTTKRWYWAETYGWNDANYYYMYGTWRYASYYTWP